MNDKQIYELVAKAPKISASELATALKVDLKDMSSALRLLVDVGDLAKSTRFGDLGRQCQVYELSEEFRRSRNGKDILVGIGNEVATQPTQAHPAETVKLPAAAPTIAAPPAAVGSKVDRAIACITKLGTATDDQLRDAMGLAAKAYPGSYLAHAMSGGRVMRNGDRWTLGPGPAPRPTGVVTSGKTPAEVKAALTEMVTAAVTELRKPDPAPAAVAPPEPREREYSCAIWLSGNVEIRKAGARVLITQDELEEIAAFVAERRVA